MLEAQNRDCHDIHSKVEGSSKLKIDWSEISAKHYSPLRSVCIPFFGWHVIPKTNNVGGVGGKKLDREIHPFPRRMRRLLLHDCTPYYVVLKP